MPGVLMSSSKGGSRGRHTEFSRGSTGDDSAGASLHGAMEPKHQSSGGGNSSKQSGGGGGWSSALGMGVQALASLGLCGVGAGSKRDLTSSASSEGTGPMTNTNDPCVSWLASSGCLDHGLSAARLAAPWLASNTSSRDTNFLYDLLHTVGRETGRQISQGGNGWNDWLVDKEDQASTVHKAAIGLLTTGQGLLQKDAGQIMRGLGSLGLAAYDNIASTCHREGRPSLYDQGRALVNNATATYDSTVGRMIAFGDWCTSAGRTMSAAVSSACTRARKGLEDGWVRAPSTERLNHAASTAWSYVPSMSSVRSSVSRSMERLSPWNQTPELVNFGLLADAQR